jgi:hypothetical protein
LSALYAAGRHEELLALIAKSEYRHKSWHNRVWGAKALAAAGKGAEAIRYAEDSKGLNAPLTAIAAFCEGVLLDSGCADEAYARYAVAATYATTNLATFKAIVKKYPHMPRESILRDLVASQPGNEGKWFAAAKDNGIDTGNGLLGAKSWAACERRLATIRFLDMAPRDVIDSTAEAFSLHPEHLAFSPYSQAAMDQGRHH